MTAIERLRELLDERGADYRVSATGYSIDIGPHTTAYANRSDTTLDVSLRQVTPEQAIAATLGQESDDAAMVKLHDQMNAAMLEYEMAQGIEKRDGDEAIVVPWVAKIHALLEEAAALGSCNCSNNCTNGERTRTCLPHFWTHDGTLHVELPKLPESISVRLPDQRDREVGSARVWQYTLGNGGVGRTNDGLADLQAENAKLRELVRDLWLQLLNAYDRKEVDEFADRMRELGVEGERVNMLSVQCDELRKAARGQKAMGLLDLAQMLNDAADTIWELRDSVHRERAEADKLRERITTQKQTIQAYRDESREWREVADHVQAENAKLRELLDYMTPIAWYAASERERDRMRELGVEVDG